MKLHPKSQALTSTQKLQIAWQRIGVRISRECPVQGLKPSLINSSQNVTPRPKSDLHSLATRGFEQSTAQILSIFFIRALKNGIIKANPVLPIKQFKESSGEKLGRRPFTLTELKLIYSKAPSPFWRYMILGGFYTGLRMGDLIRLPRIHIDLEANLIRTTPSKTRDRVVHIPIAAPLRKLLEETIILRSSAKQSDPLWPEEAENYEKYRAKVFSNEFYDKVLAPAGLVPARSHHRKQKNGRASKREVGNPSFHCLRHTFVSLLKATGGNQAVAKELAGHSSDMVSDLYTHLPVETLSAAIAKLPEVGQ